MKKRVFLSIFFVLLILSAFIYQSVRGTGGTPVSDMLAYPIGIIESGISRITNGVVDFFEGYIFLKDKAIENRRLALKLQGLTAERNKLAEARHENERLRALLELRASREDYITSADVFARDPGNWFHVLWINKGSADGINKDMIAVTPLGIVGKVYRVLGDRAGIILITDVNSSVAVRFQSLRTEGILEGLGVNTCHVKYVSHDEDIKTGEVVVTSGLDGIFPEGIRVGYVSNITKKGQGFFQNIEVRPFQDLSRVEEVAILKK
ncbi:MAG: rod shape-determining protein MreC [Nitrospirae bacterium]|nr:rod shape-determining protein MreC [Nitrospirota bacterium]